MSKTERILRTFKRSPMTIVEVVWSVALILNGTFFLSPFYEPQPGSVFIDFADSPYVYYSVSVLYLVAGFTGLWAVYRGTRKARNVSTILFFMAFLFTTIFRWVELGLTPTTWIWPLLLAFVAAIHNISLYWQEGDDG